MLNDDRKKITARLCSVILLVSLLVITVVCFSNGINGNDFWWHIKVGEWVVENRQVPTTDIFSWFGVQEGLSWTAHEWLSDVIFFAIYSLGGEVAIFLLSLCASLGMIALICVQTKPYIEKNFLFGGLFLCLFAVVCSLFFYGRPHIFSYFLLFTELKILYDFFEDPNSKKIFFIPVIAALWSNLHGGSSNLSYILCILFLLSGSCNLSFGRVESVRLPKGAWLKLIWATAGAVLGILANPIGIQVLVYPYVNLSDSLSMNLISEWQAPDAKLVGSLILYFLPILIMTIGIFCDKKQVRLIDCVIMLAFLYLFFRSARFIVLWYIAAVFYAFRYMPEIKVKAIRNKWDQIAVGALVVLLMVPLTLGIVDMVSVGKDGNLISTVMSDEAIQVVREDEPERIFNDYNLGEALIYYGIPVFFDARADLYAQKNIMADGVSLMYMEPMDDALYVDVDRVIGDYQFDAILITKGRPLYGYMMSSPEKFNLIYSDEDLAYFRVIGGSCDE